MPRPKRILEPESYSREEVQDIVRQATNLKDIMFQLNVESDIAIWQAALMPGELASMYQALNQVRRDNPDVSKWRRCDPPPGFCRPLTGTRQIAEDHKRISQ